MSNESFFFLSLELSVCLLLLSMVVPCFLSTCSVSRCWVGVFMVVAFFNLQWQKNCNPHQRHFWDSCQITVEEGRDNSTQLSPPQQLVTATNWKKCCAAKVLTAAWISLTFLYFKNAPVDTQPNVTFKYQAQCYFHDDLNKAQCQTYLSLSFNYVQ